MPKRIDIASLTPLLGTTYPPPYDEPCRARQRTRLGDAAGLTQFGVNLLRLPPGAWSAQRHWHVGEDEFVYVVAGEVVLVTDAGEEMLRPGDCAGFKADDGNGHCLQNRSNVDATVLEIGTRVPGGDTAYYPECDMVAVPGGSYAKRDGTPYPKQPRRGA
ncbi:MAG TPA: cupin domain-containing protein [Stellaceae bacterium]|nr:cupin domain-containing protein [Stellaceae bacterium]